MNFRKASFLRVTFVVVFAAVLSAGIEPAAAAPLAMSIASKTSIDADGPIAVRGHRRARGAFEQALIDRAIAGGVVADPDPLYGRYLGYHGYPGHFPCCYEPRSFERIYNPYYSLSRAGSRNPTWWDYPVHWEGW